MRGLLIPTLVLLIPALPCSAEDDGKWVTVKGRFIWDTDKGPAPKRAPLKADKDANVAAMDKDFNSEEWIVNAKNGGIKNVVVWLTPEPTAEELKALATRKIRELPSFKPADIHPKLAKPAQQAVEMDQPCCRFIPHFVLARTGQDMVIKNSAPITHNARWISDKNGEFNFIISSGKDYVVKDLKAETHSITISCDIHKWMRAYVRVFDHPYFALTDEDGKFAIKDVPVLKGKLRLLAFHEEGAQHGGVKGRAGQSIDVKPGAVDLGAIKLDFPKPENKK